MRDAVTNVLQPLDDQIERTAKIPADAIHTIRDLGLFGSHTPAEYGGLGLDMAGNTAVIREMARAHIAYFYTYSMNVHIASKPIELYGNEALKQRFLPRLASGEAIGAYALTELNAGSDAGAMAMTAVRDGDQYILNGSKRYITNAPIADLITVFAATAPGERTGRRASGFVVEAGTPGIRIGDNFEMAGGRGSFHSEVVFDDCLVPAENRIGDEGQGFAMAMEALDAGRVNWAAYCAGAARHLLNLSIAHARERQQFGKPLAANQGLQWMLADMEGDVHTAEIACEHAALSYDDNPGRRAFAGARAKLIASEAAGRVADTAVQIFGGEGYRKDRPIERIWRELRGIRILEGTSEVMRQIIARDLTN